MELKKKVKRMFNVSLNCEDLWTARDMPLLLGG
jgi:hypothetical protein